MTDTERGLAFALGPAVFTAVANRDQHAHGLMPGAYGDEQQLGGCVRGKVVGQGIAMAAVQLIIAPHPTWLGDDHRAGSPSPTRRSLDRDP